MKGSHRYFLGILGAVIVAGAALLFLPATPTSAPQARETGSQTLVAEEPFFDFGTISMSVGKVAHTFVIKNTSATETVIDNIYTSCMCTTAKLTTRAGSAGPFGMPGHEAILRIAQRIAPGEEAQVDTF